MKFVWFQFDKYYKIVVALDEYAKNHLLLCWGYLREEKAITSNFDFISPKARMTFMQEWLFCNPIMHYFREYFGERDLNSDGGPVNCIIWFPLNWNVRYKKTQDSIGKSKLHTRCREIWAIIRLYDLERAKVHDIKDNMLLDR